MKLIRMRSQTPRAVPVIILVLIMSPLCPFQGCNEETLVKKEPRPDATLQQLQAVYGKTIQRSRMYGAFAKEAEKNKLPAIAKLYRALLRSEQIHTSNHLAILKKHGLQPAEPKPEKIVVGSWKQTLKMALSMEDFAVNSLYPGLIRLADCDSCAEAAKEFRAVLDAEKKHAELLRYALAQGLEMPSLNYHVCPICGYLVTTEETPECPACKSDIRTFEDI